MLTTNNTKPEIKAPRPTKVLVTGKVKPREQKLADLKSFTGVDKRETRKVKGDMLTTANYVERAEAMKPKPKKKVQKRNKK